MNTDNNILLVLICSIATLLASTSSVAYGVGHIVPEMDQQKQQDICIDAWTLDLDGNLRGFLSEEGESQCYRVDISRPGILVVAASGPGTASVEPKLGFFGRECISGQQSTASLILAIREPGTYYFCVASQDPMLPLGEFKLIARFVPRDVTEIFLRGKMVDEELILDPGVIETELDPPVDPDPDSDKSRSLVRQELCRTDDRDDHSDTFVCATPLVLGDSAEERISSPWDDNSDYFTFVITSRQTVRIRTSGDTDTFGGLYDEWGHRLAADDDGGEGGNFRIVKSLSAGRYFVRVEGHGGKEGPYNIETKALGW